MERYNIRFFNNHDPLIFIFPGNNLTLVLYYLR